MDALAEVTQRIPAFAGYATEEDRRLSDELVRSYLGEALADLQDRLTLDPATCPALETLVLRCEFANQMVYRTYADTEVDDAAGAKLAASDACVLDLADRAATADTSGVDAYLAEAKAALDDRDRTMASIVSTRERMVDTPYFSPD
jgi:hypothetical protein